MRESILQQTLKTAGPDVVKVNSAWCQHFSGIESGKLFGSPAVCGPPVEGLEHRVLFAADAQVVGSILVVTGTSAGERIDVYQENGVNNDVIKVKFDNGTPFNFLDNQFTS